MNRHGRLEKTNAIPQPNAINVWIMTGFWGRDCGETTTEDIHRVVALDQVVSV